MSDTSYIHAGWLLDGTGGPVQEKVLLEIRDSRIASITPFRRDQGVPQQDVTDLSHCTILPPLVDSHVHLFMSATTDKIVRENQLVAEYDQLRPIIGQHLHYLFSHGVLAVRDGGDRGGFALRYRSETQMHPGVALSVTGRAYHSKGRYGGLIGRTPEGGNLESTYEDDGEGKDFVKIVNSGLNSLSVFSKETAPQFSREVLSEVVRIAGQKGQKVMVHANGQEAVKNAVEAGCHSIEHGFFMGEDNLLRMADRGTRWIPTVYTMKAYGENLAPGENGADYQVMEKNVLHQLEQLRRARELGVEVVLGTDAGSLGVIHGESMVEEMKLFKKAGYSLAELIGCATAKGAKLLGIDHFGELCVGNKATFLVARGAPAQLPRKLSYLEHIYMDGNPSELYRKNPVKYINKSAAD